MLPKLRVDLKATQKMLQKGISKKADRKDLKAAAKEKATMEKALKEKAKIG